MREASYCNYYFLDKHRSYLEKRKFSDLLETNFNFKSISKYLKESRHLIDNISNGISNCLNYILKLRIFEIYIFLNITITKILKQIEDYFIQSSNLKKSIIYKEFLMYKTKEGFFII